MSIRLPWLDAQRTDGFPPTCSALKHPNGLLCAGGDLLPARLRAAYAQGIFPWFSAGEPILWWSPDPRCVLELADAQPSRSLRKWCRRSDWSLSTDQDFAAVIRACAEPRARQDGTWISPPMLRAYEALHLEGVAHSIEVRDATGLLIGGLYGLALGRVFFGESMFSRRPQASKVALFALAAVLRELDYVLLDGQVESAHLRSLGFALWERQRFEAVLPGDSDIGTWPTRWPLADPRLLG